MSNAFNSWVWWAEAKTDASHGREVGERVCVCVYACVLGWEGRTGELHGCFV